MTPINGWMFHAGLRDACGPIPRLVVQLYGVGRDQYELRCWEGGRIIERTSLNRRQAEDYYPYADPHLGADVAKIVRQRIAVFEASAS